MIGADIGDLDLLEFTRTWRAGYMRRTKAIAAGEPGPTNVDALHREVRRLFPSIPVATSERRLAIWANFDQLLDELLGESKWSELAVWDDAARTELCNFWHRLDGSSSPRDDRTTLTDR